MKDEEFKERHIRVEEEARRNHDAIDRVWMMDNPGKTLPVWKISTSSPSPSTKTRTVKEKESEPFPLTAEVVKIINPLSVDANITTRSVVEPLGERFPELAPKIASGMTAAQVAGVLNRLAKQGKLRIAKRGFGAAPNVYRKTEKWGQNE